MAIHWIIAGMDGTGSRDWGRPDFANSHIKRFCNDFDTVGSNNRYFHGPSSDASDYNSILENVKCWIGGQIDYYKSHYPYDEIRLCLIGHSRGGGAVIDLAKYLGNRQIGTGSIQVYFMALYDPVIMNRLNTDLVENVKYIARSYRAMIDGSIQSLANLAGDVHERAEQMRIIPIVGDGAADIAQASSAVGQGLLALRSRNTRSSRSNFRITGLSRGPGIEDFDEPRQRFDTSHGGMGGDPGLFNTGLSSDGYCNCYANFSRDNDELRHHLTFSDVANLSDFLRTNYPQQIIRIRNCISQSREADRHIRAKARQHQIPLKSQDCNHIPYNDDVPRVLIEALRHLHVPV